MAIRRSVERNTVADDTMQGVESERNRTYMTVAFGRLTPRVASRASGRAIYYTCSSALTPQILIADRRATLTAASAPSLLLSW
jgi:hypothetical protein